MSKTPKLWKSPTQVNTTDHAFGGEIAGLQDGGYVVVWENAGFHSILGQRYDSAGNKVGGEVLLSPSASNNNYGSPAVTILSNGNIAVAFTHLDSSAPDLDVDIYVRIFGPALDLLRTDTIDTSNAKQTYDPSLTALADGSYVVAYTAGVGDITPTSLPDDTDIVARIVSPTGVVGGQFDIDNQNDNRDLSQLATLSNGNFVAVYQDEFLGSATDSDIRFGIFTPTGAHVGPRGSMCPGLTAVCRNTIPTSPHCAMAALSSYGPTPTMVCTSRRRSSPTPAPWFETTSHSTVRAQITRRASWRWPTAASS
jgi:large repetitive protein